RLDFLDTGDELTSVRAAFSWSYRRLSEPAARLFRLLGAHTGPDFSAPAAASLAGVPDALPALDELTDAHLLTRTPDERYYFHDLVRIFARGLTTEDERRDAVQRLLDHYLHSAYRSRDPLAVSRNRLTLADPLPEVTPETLPDEPSRWAWYEAEIDVLTSLVTASEQAGFDTRTWQLTWFLTTALERTGRWQEWSEAAEIGLAAAERLGDVYARSRMRHFLGRAYRRAGRLDESVTAMTAAIEDYRGLGELIGEGSAFQVLAALHGEQGRPAEALAAAREALALAEQADDRLGAASALNQIGWFCGELGDHRAAIEHCERAVVLHQQAGDADRVAEAVALDSVAHSQRHLGDLAGAAATSERAVEIFRAASYRVLEAQALVNLGDTHHAAGEAERARQTWQYALAIYEHLGDRAADQVRDRLTEWAATPSSG
ncbi:tetratricopeptide repeat protein, partial [Lentzea sp. PSKA42]